MSNFGDLKKYDMKNPFKWPAYVLRFFSQRTRKSFTLQSVIHAQTHGDKLQCALGQADRGEPPRHTLGPPKLPACKAGQVSCRRTQQTTRTEQGFELGTLCLQDIFVHS